MKNNGAKQIVLQPNIQVRHKASIANLAKPLIIHTEEYIEIVPQNEIRFLKSDSNYTCITLFSGRSILASKTMGTFEKSLSKLLFIRCHQSFIVNQTDIRRIKKNPTLSLHLSDDSEIPVSRSKRKMVIDRLTNI